MIRPPSKYSILKHFSSNGRMNVRPANSAISHSFAFTVGDTDGATDLTALGESENAMLGVVDGAMVHFGVTMFISNVLSSFVFLPVRLTILRLNSCEALVSSTTLIVPV